MFLFSSRRRHTRLQGDWSSDVCSSDLVLIIVPLIGWAISKLISLTGRFTSRRAAFWTKQGTSLLVAVIVVLLVISIWFRLEERRVGKEGRSRWLPDHLKKKKIRSVRLR